MNDQKQKDMSGALFKNKKARDSRDPGYQGNVTIGGKDYWISAWLNEAKATGEKYFSLRVKPKEANGAASKPVLASAAEDDPDGAPF